MSDMQLIKLGKSDVLSSRLVYGCYRILGNWSEEDIKKGKLAVQTAIEQGYNHFDNADFYGHGKCEEVFGEVLQDNPGVRDKIIITSKCGIIRVAKDSKESGPNRYDFSKKYILKSVEASLARLKIDYLDMLLLHRPDYLGDPEEVTEAFQELKASSKVLNFGISNFKPSQVSMLQKYCPFPLLVNQVEINIHNINSLIDGTLDQCLEMKISPQAWCPLGGVVYPAWGNTFSKEDEARIKLEFDRQAKKYATENWIIMLAWILKHPANVLPIIGTTTPARIKMAKDALALDYSREDWYSLLEARNGCPAM